jgi:hypothetical protein
VIISAAPPTPANVTQLTRGLISETGIPREGGKHYGPMQIPLLQFAAPDADGFLGTPFFEGKACCIGTAGLKATIR